jgi:CRP-like cAMP-binding protein
MDRKQITFRANWLIKPKSSSSPSTDSGSISSGAPRRNHSLDRIMSSSYVTSQPCENQLLSLLSAGDYGALMPYLETVDLSVKQVLGERGNPYSHVYFPCSAVVSVLAMMKDGAMVEVGTIGNEGFYGIDVLVGGESAIETTICQIAGKALRMRVADFICAIDGNTPLRHVTQRYLMAYLSLVSQSVACNALHTIEARFARWILMTHDRVLEDDFHLTQEFLANMLGAHRPTVSVVAGAFQQAGMIRFNRGHMAILRREALEEATCECYGIVKEQFERTLGPLRKERRA